MRTVNVSYSCAKFRTFFMRHPVLSHAVYCNNFRKPLDFIHTAKLKKYGSLCALRNVICASLIAGCGNWAIIRVTYSPPVILRKVPRICANVGRWSVASFQQDLIRSTSGFPSSVVSGSCGRYGMLSPFRTRFTTSNNNKRDFLTKLQSTRSVSYTHLTLPTKRIV